MANKPAPRKWHDIQIVIATISLALTLGFWNLFASPDRVSAMKRAQELAARPPSQPMQTSEPAAVQPTAVQQLSNGPIFFGGSAPQTRIINQGGGGGNGNNGGGTANGGGTGSS